MRAMSAQWSRPSRSRVLLGHAISFLLQAARNLTFSDHAIGPVRGAVWWHARVHEDPRRGAVHAVAQVLGDEGFFFVVFQRLLGGCLALRGEQQVAVAVGAGALGPREGFEPATPRLRGACTSVTPSSDRISRQRLVVATEPGDFGLWLSGPPDQAHGLPRLPDDPLAHPSSVDPDAAPRVRVVLLPFKPLAAVDQHFHGRP